MRRKIFESSFFYYTYFIKCIHVLSYSFIVICFVVWVSCAPLGAMIKKPSLPQHARELLLRVFGLADQIQDRSQIVQGVEEHDGVVLREQP